MLMSRTAGVWLIPLALTSALIFVMATLPTPADAQTRKVVRSGTAKYIAKRAPRRRAVPSTVAVNPNVTGRDAMLLIDAQSGRELEAQAADELRHPASLTVPRLIGELGSARAQARSQALHTLSKIGDRSAWPAITRAHLTDPCDEVARSAWRAAVILVPEADRPALADVLASQLGRGGRDTQLSLSRALVALGEAAAPALRTARSHRDPGVRQHAIATERLRRDPDAAFGYALEEAKRVVQSLLTIFVEGSLGDKRKDADSAKRFIDEQIKLYEQKLVVAENALKEFKRQNLGMMPSQGRDFVSKLQESEARLMNARLELRQVEKVASV